MREQLPLGLLDGPTTGSRVQLAEGATLLRGEAAQVDQTLLTDLAAVLARAPFRHMITRGGLRMSVGMTSCGTLGWISDRAGYRYQHTDPESGRPWPAMPASFAGVATRAAAHAGFEGFVADACLINRYDPGCRLTPHQDKDERDFSAPIVSVSLGIPATFLFGGVTRKERAQRILLQHGDVVVWGGPARLRYHGVLPVKDATHALLGRRRINLTFRRAG